MKFLAAILFTAAVAAAQIMQGGAQIPALSLPAYGLVLLGALVAAFGAFRFPAAPVPLAACLVFSGYLVWRALQPGADPFLAQMNLSAALACGLALVACASGFPDNQSRGWLLAGVGIVLALQLGVGLLQFTFGGEWMPAGWISEELREVYHMRFAARTRGSFLNPNHFAWAMSVGCLFSLAFAVWGRVRVWMRIVLIYFAAVFLIGVLLAASRGAMLALGCGLFVFGAISLGGAATFLRRGGRPILVGGVLTLLLVSGAAAVFYQSAWATQGRFAEMTEAGTRTGYSEAAWRAFQSRPTLGHGPGEYLYIARDYRHPNSSGDVMYVHNDWLQLLVEYGWVGFSLAVIAIVLLIHNGIRRFFGGLADRIADGQKPLSNESAVVMGGVCAAVFFCAHSLVDFNFHIPANAILAAMVLGLLAGSPRQKRRRPIRKLGGQLIVALGFLAFGGGLAWHLFRNAEADIGALRAQNETRRGNLGGAFEILDPLLAKHPENPQLILAEARAAAGYEVTLLMGSVGTENLDLDGAEAADLDFDNFDESMVQMLEAEGARLGGGVEIDEEMIVEFTRRGDAAYERIVTLRPRERRFHVERALLLARAMAPDAGDASVKKAITLDVWSGYPYSVFAEILELRGEDERVVEILETAARMPDGRPASMSLRRIRAEQEVLRELSEMPEFEGTQME